MSAHCGPDGRLKGPQRKVMDKRYIKYFDGYRAAYGLADFDDPKAFVDPESGKKKPVYRWNYEPLTEKFTRPT